MKNKIQLSFITPTAFIKDYQSQGDFVLALSHLIDLKKENEYEKAIKAVNLPILCDNGLFENHKPESLETLVEKAIRIGATHFFAPDILYSSEGTRKELDKTIKYLVSIKQKEQYRFEKDVKIAAVVQADNIEDYMKQLLDFNEDPNVDIIGLSILSIPKSFQEETKTDDIVRNRICLMQHMCMLTNSVQSKIKWKRMHLLGQGSNQRDIEYAQKYCKWIKSNDSSCCFQTGWKNKKLTQELEVPGGKVREKVDFKLKKLTKNQKECIQYNINLDKEKLS